MGLASRDQERLVQSMHLMEQISDQYDGCVLLHPPYQGHCDPSLPTKLAELLQLSNGISEVATRPDTGETIPIDWIIYPYEMIQSWTAFYRNEYGVEGTVFSDDGAGSPYLLKGDGSITCFDGADQEEYPAAPSLEDFFR